MKLLIAGSRSITSFDLSPYIPDEVDLIITGGAKGIDTLAEAYAKERGIPTLTVKPCYEKYGRAAPILRDEEFEFLEEEELPEAYRPGQALY